MVDQLSFKRKISLLVVSSFAPFVVITGISLFQTSERVMDSCRTAPRMAVQSSYDIVAGDQAAAAAAESPKEQVARLASAAAVF